MPRPLGLAAGQGAATLRQCARAPAPRRRPPPRVCAISAPRRPEEAVPRPAVAGGNSSGLTKYPGREGVASSSELIFTDDSGQAMPVMPADYGFRSGAGRLYQEGYGSVPAGAASLAAESFRRELAALRRSVRNDELARIAESNPDAPPLAKAGYAVGKAVRMALLRADLWLEERRVLGPPRPPAPSGPAGAPADAHSMHLTPAQQEVLDRVRRLTLDDAKVAAREKRREEAGQGVDAPWPVRAAYSSLCWVLDVIYANRPIQRFWFLETVARMPYFAFISMLHLYESLGWWRAGAELRKVHFAEEWNELHHLQIMEALGGDGLWVDRFLAEHAAVFYYWVLVAMYLLAPGASYTFCTLVENHATDTYWEFFEQNEELLKSIPPPLVALNYYKGGDLYLFDALATAGCDAAAGCELRRPPCNNLYDVFVNIRDDEVEHSKTMAACATNSIALDLQNAEGMIRFAESANIRSVDGSIDLD